MVKEGNVRLDVSLDANLVKAVKKRLAEKGRAKKGAMSEVVGEALMGWLFLSDPHQPEKQGPICTGFRYPFKPEVGTEGGRR